MKVHPITAICFLAVLVFMILIFEHPIFIIEILVFLMLFIRLLSKESGMFKMIKYSLYNVALLIVINPLVSQSGRTVLFQSPRIPLIGRIKITVEAIVYGADMGLKLICIFLIFLIYGMITNSDDTFSFFSKFTHKLTLTFSMTTNIIHRLKLETQRVKEVMQMRGMNFNEKKIKKRIKAYYPLLKVVFISALEGSVDRAEALHSRNYGKYKRTSYMHLKKSHVDYVFMMISIILIIFTAGSLFFHIGAYTFYPSLQPFQTQELIGIVVLGFIFSSTLFCVREGGKWKYSNYKI